MSRQILIPVDASTSTRKAFDFYVENLKKDGDTILIVHAHTAPHLSTFNMHEPFQLPTAEWSAKLKESIEKTQKLLEGYEILCESKKLKKISILKEGKPGEVVCQVAKDENAHMIVMGSRGQNAIRRTFVGSVSDYVLHHTNVPVTVVPVIVNRFDRFKHAP